MDLSRYRLEALRHDKAFVLYRGRSEDIDGTVLVLASQSPDPDPESLRRLEHEYGLATELDFGWAAKPVALTRRDGRAMLVLADRGGVPLGGLLGKPLAVERFLRLALELVAAVRLVHARGLVHKDIKPANVMVDESGGLSLTGFGFAVRMPRQARTAPSSHVASGTPEYMAPEQTGRTALSVDARTDLYSLGVTLYEMLAGGLPFLATEPDEWIHCHMARQPIPLRERVKDLPRPLEAVVLKLLAKRAEDRYQTAAGLEADLHRCLDCWVANARIDEFVVGADDRSDRLRIPENLYGRASQIDRVRAAFDQVISRGETGVVLVSGPGGVGKSSVVQAFQKSLAASGVFASGKFDQYRRNIPYDTIAQAFKDLVRRILGSDQGELERWRADLTEALGPNGQLMVNLIPELVHVIGHQRPAPELPPQDARNRFHMVFKRFLAVFAQPDRPLALFIDDVQWLDVATIELIDRLAGDAEVRNLLLICAYRDDEVPPQHRFAQSLEAMRVSNDNLEELVLAPLTADVLEPLLCDTLEAGSDTVRPLAELVFGKTEGNPFFVVQFLTALEEEGLLGFDRDRQAWRWDVGRIAAKAITENVADLIAEKMTRLPRPALDALKHLACLGSGASLTTLSAVLSRSESDTIDALWECIRARLVLRTVGAFALAHDRVQEAAYLLIPPSERPATHLRIGRALISKFEMAERKERIFELADHFGLAVSLLDSHEEREQVSELHLEAGMRAKTSTAYASALRYFQTGRDLLGSEGRGRRYRLAFDLEIQQAECEFLTGHHQQAEDRLSALSARARDNVDRAAATRLMLALYTTLGDTGQAVEVGLDYLRMVGIDWTAHPSDESFSNELDQLRRSLGPQRIEDLIGLPRMTDPAWIAAMDVLAALILPALITDKNLEAVVLLRMATLSLLHGNCDASCYAYTQLNVVLGLRVGDYQAGLSFGQLGYDLVERHGMDRFKARVFSCFSSFVMPWFRHFPTCLALIREAIEVAKAAGDQVFMVAPHRALVTTHLASGTALGEVQQVADQYLEVSRKAGFVLAADGATAALLLVRELRGSDGDVERAARLAGDKRSFEQHLTDGGPGLTLAAAWYWIHQVQASVIMHEANSLDAKAKASELLDAARSFTDVGDFHFYGALAEAAACGPACGERKQGHLLSLVSHQQQVEIWAANCPENFSGKVALLAAEVARLENRDGDAERGYEEAVRLSAEHGFVHNEALSNELAARFYAARGLRTSADAYLRNARACYVRWGAKGKVKQLDERFPEIKEGGLARPKAPEGTLLQELDLAAIMKMSRAVSGEIILDRLIERLMVTVVEHAGAVRGLLLLRKNGEMRIVAEAKSDAQAVTVDLRHHQHLAGDLPASILNYVIRTQEGIVVDDAVETNAYASDPYVIRVQARSILCLPLTRQQQTIGVLYLENNLVSHLFTSDRAAVLQLLASQAANSLENADLFSDAQRAHGQARRAADELGLCFDMMPALAWTCFPDGAFEYGNKRWHDFTGVSVEASQGDGWGVAFHPEDLDKVVGKWRELLEYGVAGEIEARMLRADGTCRMFLVQARPMRNDQGTIIKWYGTNTDIDDMKRAEEAQAALARASRMTAVGELAVSIAHEVNQPLMSIVTNAATALRWLDDDRVNVPEARRATERVVRDGHRVGDIINSIRSMAKKSPPRMIELSVNELIIEVVALMRDQLRSRDVTVNLRLADDAEIILGDRTQLQQVILNLVLNGIEAIEASDTQLRLLTIESSRGASGASITVSDTGVGLNKESQEKAFEAFFTTKPEGLGMGLSICRSIVEGHGGQMWVSSNQPRGSSFHFSLPGASQEAFHASPN